MLSEKIGRKPVYIIAMFSYVVTTALLVLTNEKYVGRFAIWYMFIIRFI